MSNIEKPREGELFRLATDIKRISKIVKKKIILSFFQKIESKEDILELTSLLLKGTDKQLTAFIEKKLEEENKAKRLV